MTSALVTPKEKAAAHTVNTGTDMQMVGGLGGISTTDEVIIGTAKVVWIHDWKGKAVPVARGMQVVGTKRIGLPHMMVVRVMYYVFVGCGDASVCYTVDLTRDERALYTSRLGHGL